MSLTFLSLITPHPLFSTAVNHDAGAGMFTWKVTVKNIKSATCQASPRCSQIIPKQFAHLQGQACCERQDPVPHKAAHSSSPGCVSIQLDQSCSPVFVNFLRHKIHRFLASKAIPHTEEGQAAPAIQLPPGRDQPSSEIVRRCFSSNKPWQLPLVQAFPPPSYAPGIIFVTH